MVLAYRRIVMAMALLTASTESCATSSAFEAAKPRIAVMTGRLFVPSGCVHLASRTFGGDSADEVRARALEWTREVGATLLVLPAPEPGWDVTVALTQVGLIPVPKRHFRGDAEAFKCPEYVRPTQAFPPNAERRHPAAKE